MGKRKRASSPKENSSERQTLSSASIIKMKWGGEIKKADAHASENEPLEKIESQDRVTTLSSQDAEAGSDDRPTPQLRISARVQNKQRREESIKVDAQQNRQKREESGKIDGHSAISSQKKVDASSQDEDEDDEKSKDSAVVKKKRRIPHNGDAKKRRRPWELWSMEDKNIFFEAINECGKDFEAIQNFLLTKMRKKGIPTCMIKNRDQVRHFYYRTLHKISKFITLTEDVKKSTLELYTLINYGELRRKVGGTLNEKKALKLHELIQKGSASVRVRGKSIRVRTPVCRGLKKLNEFPDDRELGARVPVTISIEIIPATISSWNYVQSLAHNPRVRISCSMHKTLASIIGHLQSKWRNTKRKICDSLVSSANFPVQLPLTPPRYLRLRPHNITSLNVVSVKPESHVKSCAISLSSHMQLLQRKRETDLQRKRGGGDTKGRECRPTRKKKGSSFSKEKPSEEGESKEEGKEENLSKREEEEPTGEISQEEADEGSDIEIEEQEITSVGLAVDSPHPTDEVPLPPGSDDVVMIDSCYPAKQDVANGKKIPPKPPPPGNAMAPSCDFTMEEPSFHLSPSYEEEVLSAVRNIKEEFTDSMETIHQLIALENVATSQEIEEDADIICIGESTRLSAQVRQKQKKNEGQNSGANVTLTTSSSSPREQDKSPPNKTSSAESKNEQASCSPADDEMSSAYVNTRSIDRVKLGWTSNTCGIITVGELYLMFGENKQITLVYDFEESENHEKVFPSAFSSSAFSNEEVNAEGIHASVPPKTSSEDGPQTAENTAEQESTSECGPGVVPSTTLSVATTCSSPLSMDGSLSQPSSQKGEPPPLSMVSPPPQNASSPDGDAGGSPNPSSSEAKDGDPPSAGRGNFTKVKTAVEDVSSMMAKFLYLIRLLSSKGAAEAGTQCFCGGNPPLPKNAINPLKSPSGARGCLNGLFRSPGHSKSPRSCSVSVRSPRTTILASTGAAMSPGDTPNSSPKVEKSKPASAKRLITELPEKCVTSALSETNPTIVPVKDRTPDVQGEKPSVGARTPSDIISDHVSGEFRLPVGPAPRNPACQSPNPSFNAQLSKLLRRYSRPTRRSVRKNMVVQRQLPLLPRLPKDPQGFVALKIGNLQQFNITNAPTQLSLPLNMSIAATPCSNSQTMETIASADVSPSAITPVIVSQPVTIPMVPEPFAKDIKMDNQSENVNAISVNVSGQQFLTVRMPTYPLSASHVTSVTTTTTTTTSGPRSLSSSTPLAMVTALPMSSNCMTTTTVTLTTTTTTCALPLVSESPIIPAIPFKQSLPAVPLSGAPDSVGGYSLSNILSQTIEDIPYLTTPPSTPVGPDGSHLESLLSTPSSIASKADFDTFISTSTSANLLSMEELEMASFPSSLKTTSQVLLAPPSAFCETSLLSTPTHLNPPGPINRLSDDNVSPIKLNLSSFLASPAASRSPEKSLDALLQHPTSHLPLTSASPDPTGHHPQPTVHTQQQPDDQVATPQITEEETLIPQIHIPEECNDGLPLLDISIGGTISVQQRQGPSIGVSTVVEALHNDSAPSSTTTCTGILSGLPGVSPEFNAGEISLAVTCVTTPANSVAVTGVSDSSSSLSCGRINVLEESLLHSFQESNDKMLDITLANSNSNSSFSGLLAAAAHQHSLDALMMENSLLQTPPRPLLLSASGTNVPADVKSNLGLDGESFEGLSGAVPLSPPSSPSRLLRQTEIQWMINSESNEFSLSSLLGSIEASPHKGGGVGSLVPPPSPAPPRSSVGSCQTTRLTEIDPSQQKMQTLISTLNDNSVDFTATFARLKRQTKDRLD